MNHFFQTILTAPETPSTALNYHSQHAENACVRQNNGSLPDDLMGNIPRLPVPMTDLPYPMGTFMQGTHVPTHDAAQNLFNSSFYSNSAMNTGGDENKTADSTMATENKQIVYNEHELFSSSSDDNE